MVQNNSFKIPNVNVSGDYREKLTNANSERPSSCTGSAGRSGRAQRAGFPPASSVVPPFAAPDKQELRCEPALSAPAARPSPVPSRACPSQGSSPLGLRSLRSPPKTSDLLTFRLRSGRCHCPGASAEGARPAPPPLTARRPPGTATDECAHHLRDILTGLCTLGLTTECGKRWQTGGHRALWGQLTTLACEVRTRYTIFSPLTSGPVTGLQRWRTSLSSGNTMRTRGEGAPPSDLI